VTSAFPIGADATVTELEADPYPLLARLRAAEPVSWLPVLDGWLVTRHDLALAVMRDPAAFTVDDPRFSTARVIGPSMLSLDGPRHTRHREPFARPFRPAQTRARFTEFVTDEVGRLVGEMASPAEIRADLAGPLAVAVVAEVLGLDGVGAVEIRSWYEAFVAAISDITAGRGDGSAAADARETLRRHIEKVLADGSVSSLLVEAAAQAAGLARLRHDEALTTAEIVANAAVLMFGGIDTTEGMITNAVLHLLSNPSALDAVLADPALLTPAIEESVRLEPAAAIVDRYATADVELGGAAVRAGDLVRVSISATGRDPAVFADPDRFDVHRQNAKAHLGFAHGPHFCFGAHLARLETQLALDRLLACANLRLRSESSPVGLVFRKPAALEVEWDA
jgi:cytochrome P450